MQRFKNGMNLKMIADLMGDSVQTISDTYLQTSVEERKQSNMDHRPNVY